MHSDCIALDIDRFGCDRPRRCRRGRCHRLVFVRRERAPPILRYRPRTCVRGRILNIVRPRIIVLVIGRCSEERFLVWIERIRRQSNRGRVCASFDYGVDEPKLEYVHDYREDAHGTVKLRQRNVRCSREWTHNMTWAASLVPRKLSNHSPSLKIPGQRANNATTSAFMVVKAKMYTDNWRNQWPNDGGVPYFPDSKPLNPSFSVNIKAIV